MNLPKHNLCRMKYRLQKKKPKRYRQHSSERIQDKLVPRMKRRDRLVHAPDSVPMLTQGNETDKTFKSSVLREVRIRFHRYNQMEMTILTRIEATRASSMEVVGMKCISFKIPSGELEYAFPSNLPPVRPPRDLFQPLTAATTDVAMATIAIAPAATSPEQPSAAPSAAADIDLQSQLRDLLPPIFDKVRAFGKRLEAMKREVRTLHEMMGERRPERGRPESADLVHQYTRAHELE